MSPITMQPEQQIRPTAEFQPLPPSVEDKPQRSSNATADLHARFGNAAIAGALKNGERGLTPDDMSQPQSGMGNAAISRAAQTRMPTSEPQAPASRTETPLAGPSLQTAWKSPAETVSAATAQETSATAPAGLETKPDASAETGLAGSLAPGKSAAEAEPVEAEEKADVKSADKAEARTVSSAQSKTASPASSVDGTPTKAPAGKAEAIEGKAKPGGAEAKAGPTEVAEPPSPREAMAPAIGAVRNRAAGHRKHPPASKPVGSAQGAAKNPKTEQTRGTAAATVVKLDAAKEGTKQVKRDDFRAKLKAAIKAATPEPKSESEAERVKKTGAKTASDTLRGALTTERDTAVGPLKTAASAEVSPATQPVPPETKLELEQVGPPAAPVSAAPVVPSPLPPERLDYSSDRAPTDNLMAENDVTKEQMEQGNDPAFGPTLEARTTAETHEATAEARYRQSESKVQDKAHGDAQQSLAQGLTGMHGARALQIGQVVGQQVGTNVKDAAERQRITDKINTIKNETKADVGTILSEMETEATGLFEAGLKRAEEAYEDAFEEAKGGIGTWLTTWGSDWEKHIEKSLATAQEISRRSRQSHR